MIWVCKKFWPLCRGEGDSGNQLWVVAQTVTLVSISPCPVEDEFAIGIVFYISRTGTDKMLDSIDTLLWHVAEFASKFDNYKGSTPSP